MPASSQEHRINARGPASSPKKTVGVNLVEQLPGVAPLHVKLAQRCLDVDSGPTRPLAHRRDILLRRRVRLVRGMTSPYSTAGRFHSPMSIHTAARTRRARRSAIGVRGAWD